nr:hypothetical protein [Tanacetum cinerariifolium]
RYLFTTRRVSGRSCRHLSLVDAARWIFPALARSAILRTRSTPLDPVSFLDRMRPAPWLVLLQRSAQLTT